MITREEALKFLNERVENKNIIKHMIALEAVMGGIYRYLKELGKQDLVSSQEEWTMAGLVHDGDYSDKVPAEKQGIQVTAWLRDEGYEVPEKVAYAMAAHNWHNTGVEPKSLMDWSIFIADSLTGLIVAATLVLPGKKLADLTVESVLKRFKEKSFAKGTRREEILWCQEKLGLSLEELVAISLKSMQGVAQELGL
jgi:predicted hydrolase (HD superfamily)